MNNIMNVEPYALICPDYEFCIWFMNYSRLAAYQTPCSPFTNMDYNLNLSMPWISKYIHHKMLDEITYTFQTSMVQMFKLGNW